MMDLSKLRSMADRLHVKLRIAEERIEEERKGLREARASVRHAEEAQHLLQTVAQQVQETAHRQIAGVVTKALQAAGFDYTFEIQFQRKRGKTEAKLRLRQGKLVLDDPMNQASGGALDVASFALRIVCLLLRTPKPRRLLVLDEPFRFVNGERNQALVAQMVEVLAEEMGVQIVMVTDDSWLEIGAVRPIENSAK